MARLLQMIECEQREGHGKHHDPVRMVREYWTTDGELLAVNDPCQPILDRGTGMWIFHSDNDQAKWPNGMHAAKP